MKKRLAITAALLAVGAAALKSSKTQTQPQPQYLYYRASTSPDPAPQAQDTRLNDALSGAIDGLLSKLGAWGGEMSSSGVSDPQTHYTAPAALKTGVKAILDVIGSAEAGAMGYNAYYSRISAADAPPKPLTRLTVGQVLDWQDSIDAKYNSEAAGRYQVMEDTLRGLVKNGVVSRSDRFDATTQDRIGVALLNGRGLADYQAGRISAETLANNIAKEWAGLPVVSGSKAGRSYYDGFNGNSATTTVATILTAIKGA